MTMHVLFPWALLLFLVVVEAVISLIENKNQINCQYQNYLAYKDYIYLLFYVPCDLNRVWETKIPDN